jgi:hypothetical protein
MRQEVKDLWGKDCWLSRKCWFGRKRNICEDLEVRVDDGVIIHARGRRFSCGNLCRSSNCGDDSDRSRAGNEILIKL